MLFPACPMVLWSENDDIFLKLHSLDQDSINFFYENVVIPSVHMAKYMHRQTIGQNNSIWKSYRQVSVPSLLLSP
jgi:hypothetical protein